MERQSTSETPPNSAPPAGDRRELLTYESPGAALRAVREEFHYWSGRITDHSFQLSLAVIAANWAVFSSVEGILKNAWARWSILSVLLCLAINLVGARRMSELHRTRFAYAEADQERWRKDFELTKGKVDPWPFTLEIERLGAFMRECKTWLPIIGGVLFVCGLIFA
jgi:hypothetical protein